MDGSKALSRCIAVNGSRNATIEREYVCLNALTSRMDVPVRCEGIDASQAGAAGSADLGGSSKYSGE